MPKNLDTILSQSILTYNGQDFDQTSSNPSNRFIFPARVVEVIDGAGYNRIKAQIINIDDEGRIYSGRDKDSTSDQLICIPLLPEYLHVRARVGECVLVFLDNPSDPNCTRYYIGPIITQQTQLEFQSFQASNSIFNKLSVKDNQIGGGPSARLFNDAGRLFASKDEIAFQGRNNSDLVLGSNSVKIRTAIFDNLTDFKENTLYPCSIELKLVDKPISTTGVRLADSQINSDFEIFSQQNIKATNINLISPEGKFRKISEANNEIKYNPRLNDFGEEAKTLHPAVLGDELVDILITIINYLFTHVHTPQRSPLVNNYAIKLENVRNKQALSAKILSNHIRLN